VFGKRPVEGAKVDEGSKGVKGSWRFGSSILRVANALRQSLPKFLIRYRDQVATSEKRILSDIFDDK
jgi:hypothetical protein